MSANGWNKRILALLVVKWSVTRSRLWTAWHSKGWTHWGHWRCRGMASLSSWMEPFLGLTTLKNCEDTFHTTFNTFNGVNGAYNVKHFTVARGLQMHKDRWGKRTPHRLFCIFREQIAGYVVSRICSVRFFMRANQFTLWQFLLMLFWFPPSVSQRAGAQ